MSENLVSDFFAHPILNSPYKMPARHWELDPQGQPTQRIVDERRPSSLATPIIPKPQKTKGSQTTQTTMLFNDLSTESDSYDDRSPIINAIRQEVESWRNLPVNLWQVTGETQKLLQHWRNHNFSGIRPFFCQIEAIETLIWLTEVAPKSKNYKLFLEDLEKAKIASNTDLLRIALKLATGAGKTTVMAMIIAWQTVNAVRRPNSQFTNGFLVVTPGLTIKDRLRVLKPNDPDSYYASRELVPMDMLGDIKCAKIVITNYHAFKLREKMEISAGGKALLKGRMGDDILTTESEGQMVQRVMTELMGMKNIMIINDEAHHCYREKADESEEEIKGEEKDEAKENNEMARLWISGLEMVERKMGISRVVDLSATPFFLRGSGYREGSLFPWTVSDFSLLDAIECGIVKLPRVPISDNMTTEDVPVFRDLWKHIGTEMIRATRGNTYKDLNPDLLPIKLTTAIDALYGHYTKTYEEWVKQGIESPPCFIVVCQNIAISKWVFEYLSGYERKDEDGNVILLREAGKFPLFNNYQNGERLARPFTLLIDSRQLESDDALDDKFKDAAADEIELFKREIVERSGNRQDADDLTAQNILREVMNTVGKPGKLGASIRCVVSVSMLTEGWDANNVTHILGIRAFGTQLLCEQVVGRALRRQNYELNEQSLFNPEYADIFGVPFNFAASGVIAPPQPPKKLTLVKAMSPERDKLEISFPCVSGYRAELPKEEISASFNENSRYELTPDEVGPTRIHAAALIGERQNFDLEHLKDERQSKIVYHLTQHLMLTTLAEPDTPPKLHLFGPLKKVVTEWVENYLICKGDTCPALLLYKCLADKACQRIKDAIVRAEHERAKKLGIPTIKAILNPFHASGTSLSVNFPTTKETLWATEPHRCHVNYVVYDSNWESLFCQVLESHQKVVAYVKNHRLGFEVPYQIGNVAHLYYPDFIVRVDDGHGADDLLNLVVEIKGFRGEDAQIKADTMQTYWIPGVNYLKTFGRWAFLELREPFMMEYELNKFLDYFDKELQTVLEKG